MMKYYIWLVLSLAVAALLFLFLWRVEAEQKRLYKSNVEVLASQAQTYRVRDSLGALSVGVLQLKVSELRRLRAQDALLIRDMGVRLSRVQSVARIATVGSYEFRLSGDSSWSLNDQFVDFRAVRDSSILAVEVQIRDTIVQILHRVPRFKLFGIWFGTKGVRQEIVSKNPHTRIVASEFLKIVR